MKFTHRFRLTAHVDEVAAFHSCSTSMAAITPPPLIARIHSSPAQLTSGDTMDFTLWAGPLPIRWTARIENASSTGFTDRQLRGPFSAWTHRHSFCPVDDHITEVVDEVEAVLKRHLFWGPVGAVMWIGMPLLFAFRARRTRRLLEREME